MSFVPLLICHMYVVFHPQIFDFSSFKILCLNNRRHLQIRNEKLPLLMKQTITNNLIIWTLDIFRLLTKFSILQLSQLYIFPVSVHELNYYLKTHFKRVKVSSASIQLWKTLGVKSLQLNEVNHLWDGLSRAVKVSSRKLHYTLH